MQRVWILLAGLVVGFTAGVIVTSEAPGHRGPLRRGSPEEHRADAPVAPSSKGGEAAESRRRNGVEQGHRRKRIVVHDGGEPLPPDLLEAAIREAEWQISKYEESVVRTIAPTVKDRARRRLQHGEVGDDPLVLQVATPGAAKTRLAGESNSARFAIDSLGIGTRTRTHVSGGIVPPGMAFVIERARVLAVLGSPDGRRGGDLTVGLPFTNEYEWDDRHVRLEFELSGREFLRHGQETLLSLAVESGAASLEVFGHLIPESEIDNADRRRFRITQAIDGFLTGEPVLMQVCADHGGGNPRTLRLDGSTNGRFDIRSDANAWDPSRDLRALKKSTYYSERCGFIPPGKVFRVTEIRYRAVLDPERKRHSDFVISANGRVLYSTTADKQRSVAGSWSGELLIKPGDENGLTVTCSYFGVGEIVVLGTIIDR